MKWYKFMMIAALTCCMACNDDGGNNDNNGNNTGGNNDIPQPPVENPIDTHHYVGADLSQWLVYKEDGAVWKCEGTVIDNLPAFFAESGYNVARLRLFVDPDKSSTACQDLDYVIESATAMQAAGMNICLDFHYSDTWADPAKQHKPQAWSTLDVTALKNKIYDYTRETLQTLKNHHITPSHIQIGNEITAGMLWNTGRVSVWGESHDTPQQWDNFLGLLRNAAKACREECPDARIIVHIDRGGDAETARRYYERIADIDYDIIGLSYYPYWHGTLGQLGNTLRTLSNTFPKKAIMIVETGFGYNEWSDDSATTAYGNYASTPEGQKQFLTDLVTTIKQYDNVTGIFYWFPEETLIDWRSSHRIDLNRGLFDKETGEALPAFDALCNFGESE